MVRAQKISPADVPTLLRAAGYVLDESSRVWEKVQSEPIAYSDGDEVENYLLKTIQASSDRSVLSAELAMAIRDWPTRYHLSAQRANLLRPVTNDLGETILELGAGCGALTRYLGESGKTVIAVEGSRRRASICRARCAELDNVVVVCDRVELFTPDLRFDAALLVGVLEYAPVFLPDAANPAMALLEHARKLLAPHGRLVVAIENKLGAKYLAGAPEDHLGRVFAGINHEYGDATPITFGRVELQELLHQSGFAESDFFAAFPGYKLSSIIVHADGCSRLPKDTLIGLLQFSDRMDAQGFSPLFSTERFLGAAIRNGMTIDLANSFLVLAQVTSGPRNVRPLASHFGGDRVGAFSKVTTFELDDDKRNLVVRRASSGNNVSTVVTGDGTSLTQIVEAVVPLIEGKLWTTGLIDVVNRPGWRLGQLTEWVAGWLDAIEREFGVAGLRSLQLSTLVPAAVFDATPFNLLVRPDGSTQFFDLEWRPDPAPTLGHVLFRGLLYSLQMPTSCAEPAADSPESLESWIFELLRASGWSLDRNDLVRWWDSELAFQSTVAGRASALTYEFLSSWRLPVRRNVGALAAEVDAGRRELQLTHQHAANLEALLAGAHAHSAQLGTLLASTQTHAANLEASLAGTRAHAANLETSLAEEQAHAALLESSMSIVQADLDLRRAEIDRAQAELLFIDEVISQTSSLIQDVAVVRKSAVTVDASVARSRWQQQDVASVPAPTPHAETELIRSLRTSANELRAACARLYAWRQFHSEASGGRVARLLKSRVPVCVEPLSGVVFNHEHSSHPWMSTGNDPQFRVHGLGQFAGHWVELDFELDVPSGLGHSVLYLDLGQGFSEDVSFRIAPPALATGRSTILFVVPVGTKTIRLDPFAHAGPFSLRRVSARKVSRLIAALKMLRAIKSAGRSSELRNGAQTTGSALSFRRRMVTTYHNLVLGDAYADWVARHEPTQACVIRLDQRRQMWPRRPVISVVMPVYNTPAPLLRAAIDSVRCQSYPDWELCIANDASTHKSVATILDDYAATDPRIQVVHRSTNGHISAASNSALELSTGEFVALLDHDDRLHPLALHFIAEAIVNNSDAGIIYTDEDKLDEQGRRFDPYFKCEFNAHLFLSHNMICHLGCYRRELVERVGGFRSEFDGSQDYDLALRVIELLDRDQIVHIPRVLYHWTAIAGSTARSGVEKPYAYVSAQRAIQQHLDRVGVAAQVSEAPESPYMNRVRYALPAKRPSVCIVVPTRDRADLLRLCTESIVRETRYENYHICIIDNGSVEDETLELLRDARRNGIQVIRDDAPFNFSALNNRAVRATGADYVVLMNNDIEVVSTDWIDEMVGHAMQPRAGAVGARLWYPDGRLQHGGVVLGIGGVAGHSHKGIERGQPGYFSRAVLQQEFSAVTAACMMVKRSLYEEVGGLDERLQVAFNDVDFCLRLVRRGYQNVWTPYAEFIHHESASRGAETTPEKHARFNAEIKLMQERWGSTLWKDPAYSPNLTLETEDFAVAWPPRVQLFAEDENKATEFQIKAS